MSVPDNISPPITFVRDEPAGSAWSARIRWISWSVVVIGGVLLVLTSFSQFRRQRDEATQARVMSRSRASEYARIIDQELRQIPPVAEKVAADLSNGTLRIADLSRRLADELAANPRFFETGVAFSPFATGSGVKLFAPHAARTGPGGSIQTFQLEQRYDYTTIDWYKRGVVKPGWGEPYFGAATRTFVVGYMVPFFKPGDASSRPIGVVRVNLSLEGIRNLVSGLSLGQTGYGFLLSHKGVYMSHPLEEYVRRQLTTFDIARQMNDQSRVRAAHKALAGERTEEDSVSPINGQKTLRLLQPIPATGWVLGVVFFKDEVALDARDLRRSFIRILLSALLFGFGVGLVVFRVHRGGHQELWSAALAGGVLLTVGICVIWWLTLEYPDRNGESSIQVVDNSALQKFLLKHIQKDAAPATAEPVQIPTGILVRTVRIVDANDVVVTGNIWQRIPASQRDNVKAGMDLPDGEALELKELATTQRGEFDLMSWTFKAALRVPSEWSSKYPFDRALVRLRMIPKPSPSPVVLIPDLRGYNLLTPSSLPGIDRSVILPGWNLDHSYFSYMRQGTGISAAGIYADVLPFDLSYNLVAQRRFLDPFVSSVLPIIVVVCLLFGLLIVGSKNNLKVAATGFRATDILRASVALLFPALIAQVNLRSKVGATELIYIEYFYFILYTAILGVSANALAFTLRGSGVVQVRDNLIPKLLFWPLTLGACMVVTLVFLY